MVLIAPYTGVLSNYIMITTQLLDRRIYVHKHTLCLAIRVYIPEVSSSYLHCPQTETLSIVSYIGCGVSIACLLLTIAIIIILKLVLLSLWF